MELLRFSLILFQLVSTFKTGICLSAPKFKVAPNWPDRDYYDEDGPPIQLNCLIIDGVNFTMVWTKNGSKIDPGKEQLLLQNKNQTLIFVEPKQVQSGDYTCIAFNKAGNVSYNGTIFITARSQETRPRVIDTDPSTTVSRVQVGDTIMIGCTFDVGGSMEALMDLTLNWFKDDIALKDNNHTVFGINTTGENNQLSFLTINGIQTSDYGTYTCYGENSKGNDSSKITVAVPGPRKNNLPLYLIIGLSSGGALTIVIVVVIMLYRCRKSNKYEELTWEEPNNYDVPDHKIEYDVFISYSNENLDWVKDALFENLCNHGYEVCIDFKDFTPGMAVTENILDAVYKSHKTIVLMSHDFLKSMWGQFELQQALNRATMKRSDLMILIKFDDCKVPAKLMGKTFLDWSDVKVRPHFWSRLYEAIGEPAISNNHNDVKEAEMHKINVNDKVIDIENGINEFNENDTHDNEVWKTINEMVKTFNEVTIDR
ncbi:TIR domain [Mactra antiquata]